jgi:hypothetical protein
MIYPDVERCTNGAPDGKAKRPGCPGFEALLLGLVGGKRLLALYEWLYGWCGLIEQTRTGSV